MVRWRATRGKPRIMSAVKHNLLRQTSASRPWVMGVLNVTPDSFSDGGRFYDSQRAVDHALEMVANGADLIDVGGESTRPGAQVVSVAEELQRVIPVVDALVRQLKVPVSVDTTKPAVMEAALIAGASVINDINALNAPGAIDCLRRHPNASVCLMHMRGHPATMQNEPQYDDVVAEVKAYLMRRVEVCCVAGIRPEQIWLDPGIGFGKTDVHNLTLLAHLDELVSTGYPVLVGVSRKSTIGRVLGRQVDERLPGSLALATLAVYQGARIIRVHDVAASRDAVTLACMVRAARAS